MEGVQKVGSHVVLRAAVKCFHTCVRECKSQTPSCIVFTNALPEIIYESLFLPADYVRNDVMAVKTCENLLCFKEIQGCLLVM